MYITVDSILLCLFISVFSRRQPSN